MRLALLFALVALGLLAAPACSNETIVLAQIPSTDAGTPPAAPPTSCFTISDCASGYYCVLAACGTSAEGTCAPVPIDCPATEDPYCGCDGVTYFNDCLRQAYGIGASTAGPCLQDGKPCGGPSNASCPSGTLCAQLLGAPNQHCSPDAPGTCWVLPAQCSGGIPTDLWDSCDPNDGAVCLDTCDAIQAGGAYRRSMRCP